MKFLKVFFACKGRYYSSGTNYTDNANITQSLILRPGDFINFSTYNYLGWHKAKESTYNTPAYADGNYVKGDFCGRHNGYDLSQAHPNCFSMTNWRLECRGDSNDNIWFAIIPTDDPYVPMIRVDHSRPSERINALKSYDGTYNGVVPPDVVPMYQYRNNNGIIKTPRLFYHKYDCTNQYPAEFTSKYLTVISETRFNSGGSPCQIYTDLASSLIHLEDKIVKFLDSMGCTMDSSHLWGQELTSQYHGAGTHYLPTWCGGLKVTPPPEDPFIQGGIAHDAYFCDDVISIIRGSGLASQCYESIMDDHNNISGWCVPQSRSEGISGSSYADSFNIHPFRAGLFNTNADNKYIMTSFLGLDNCSNSHALSELTYPSGYNNNFDAKAVPMLAIIDSYQSATHHMMMRWGYIYNNAFANSYGDYTFTCSSGPTGRVCSLRDITPGAAENSQSSQMGTWGSFGLLVSTFNISSGNNVNNASQVYSPITCLITPSIISDFPALDIYGIRKRREVSGSSYYEVYEQSEPCFNYITRDYGTPWGGNQTRALQSVEIKKTIATSTPNVLVHSYYQHGPIM